MAEEPNSFYPPDLPVEITNIVTGAHTIDAQRIGKKPRVVARVKLTTGDEPTPHGKRPDNLSDEEIAAELWGKCEADAQKNCKGFARYKIVATYSKPKQGPTPDPQHFEIEVGDPPLRDRDGEIRDGVLGELQTLLSGRHREYLELMRESTKLATAVGTMATGLAGAWTTVHQKQSEGREHMLELAVLNSERESERERMRLFEKSVVPMLKLLQGKRAPLALGEADSDKPEIVRVARQLGRSLTAEQLERTAKILGADRLRELATIEEEADLLGLTGWLFAIDESKVLDAYGILRDDQIPMVEKLQNWAADEGERHAASKAS
jgi:hypothetical protein